MTTDNPGDTINDAATMLDLWRIQAGSLWGIPSESISFVVMADNVPIRTAGAICEAYAEDATHTNRNSHDGDRWVSSWRLNKRDSVVLVTLPHESASDVPAVAAECGRAS